MICFIEALDDETAELLRYGQAVLENPGYCLRTGDWGSWFVVSSRQHDFVRWTAIRATAGR